MVLKDWLKLSTGRFGYDFTRPRYLLFSYFYIYLSKMYHRELEYCVEVEVQSDGSRQKLIRSEVHIMVQQLTFMCLNYEQVETA